MLQKSYVKSALHGLGSGLGLTLLKITNQRDTAWNAPSSHCGRERWGGGLTWASIKEALNL